MKTMKKTLKVTIAILLSVAMTIGLLPMTSFAVSVDEVTQLAAEEASLESSASSGAAGEASSGKEISQEEEFPESDEAAEEISETDEAAEEISEADEATEEISEATAEVSEAGDEIAPEEIDEDILFGDGEDDYNKITKYHLMDYYTEGIWNDGAAEHLLDNDINTKWGITRTGAVFVEFLCMEPISPAGYILTTANDTAKYPDRNPKSWNIYAKEHGKNEWTLIESVKGSTRLEAKNFEPYTFMFMNPDYNKKWQRFRFEVTESQKGYGLQLSEFQFIAFNPTKNLENATISGIQAEYFCTGEPIDINYTVTASDGTVLVKDTDYTETFNPSPVKDAGKYSLTITGIGKYKGEKRTSFTVVSPDEVAIVSGNGTSTRYTDFEQAYLAWKESGNVTLKLLRDVECNYTIYMDKAGTLDLNGHGILYTGDAQNAVITVKGTSAYFTLIDSRSNSTIHYITLNNGRGVAVSATRPGNGLLGKDYLEVKGGYITGGHNGSGGGINASGNFTMSGGTICGNTADSNGGGVCLSAGMTFTMTGGEITGNTSSGRGGGVYMSYASFDMQGGRIYGNFGGSANCAVFNTIQRRFIINTGAYIYAGIEADGSDAVIVNAETAQNNINNYGYISIGLQPVIRLPGVALTGGSNAVTSGGDNIQTGLTGEMIPVTFTAQEGYYFERFEDIVKYGITITWKDNKNVVVSGTPDGDVSIVVPDAALETVPVDSPYKSYIPTDESGNALKALQVNFHGRKWYIIKDDYAGDNAGTLTLLSAECISAMAYGGESYRGSDVKAYLDGLFEGKGEFGDAADVIETVKLNEFENEFQAKLFLLSGEDIINIPVNVLKCSKAIGADHNRWLLRDSWYMTGSFYQSATVDGDTGICSPESETDTRDICGVRPALVLKLDQVSFDSATKTFNYTPAASVISLPEAITGLEYTGRPQKLISPGEVVRGSFVYAVTRENIEPNDDAYSLAIPTATDAGSYYVWYKTSGWKNAQTLNVEIKKAVYQNIIRTSYTANAGEQPDTLSIKLPDIPAWARIKTVTSDSPDIGFNDGSYVDGNVLKLNTSGCTWGQGSYLDINIWYTSDNYEDFCVAVNISVFGGADTLWVESIQPADYTGAAIKPVPVVHFGNNILDPKDYTVSYKNNINAASYDAKNGAPSVIVKGKGNYEGTVTSYFTINQLDIRYATVSDIALAYNGKVQKGKTTVTYELGGKKVTLKEKTDYTLSYSADPKDVGKYTVTVTGTGNYKETTSFTENIVNKGYMISKLKLSSIPSQEYSGKSFVLEPSQITSQDSETRLLDKSGKEYKFTLKSGSTELVYGSDYDLSYENNEEVGTATVIVTGLGNYVGTKTTTFKINGIKLSGLKSDGFVKSFDYTGSAIEQTNFGFYYMEGKGKSAVRHDLEPGRDYVADYDNNVECGTATVTYTGIGRYYGTVKKTYSIKGLSMSLVTIPALTETTGASGTRPYKDSYDAKAKAFIYTGLPFELAGVAGAEAATTNNGIVLQVVDKKTKAVTATLKNGVDYVITYRNNIRPGTAEVIFTGKGLFTGSVKKTFKIKPYDISSVDRRMTGEGDLDFTFARGGVKLKLSFVYRFGDSTTTLIEQPLKEGVDYTIKFVNNNALTTDKTKKKPAAILTGKGILTGSVSDTFVITASNLDDKTVVEAKDIVFAEKPGICKTAVTLTDLRTGKKLIAGTDYEKTFTYSYAEETTVKRAVYTGKKITGFEENVVIAAGTPVDQKFDIIPAGTKIKVEVTGKGGYGASDRPAAAYFYVVDKDHDLSKATITISPKAYTGSKIELTSDDITFTINKAKVPLALGEDYEVIYDPKSDYTNKGTYKVTIKGKGEKGYGFSKTVSFKIVARTLDDAISINDEK